MSDSLCLLRSEEGICLRTLEMELMQSLRGRVRRIELERRPEGLVLGGHAYSFYGKQLALHGVMQRTTLPVIANRIEVESTVRKVAVEIG